MIKVICGIIYNDNKIFIARRKKEKTFPGKWEFPGGKIEMSESEQTALTRELEEEFGMAVDIKCKLGSNTHKYDDFKINLVAYKCEFIKASFLMSDHDECKWVSKNELKRFEFTEADIPLINLI